MSQTILYYPTGIVHFRNLKILKQILPEYKFLIIIEGWLINKKSILNEIPENEQIIVNKSSLSNALWDKKIDKVFLCMAYPNLLRLNIVYNASKRNIPVISIEEVNQLALNNSIINHYFLPIDCLGVVSDVEKERFIEIGYNKNKLRVTGWPFYEDRLLRDNINIKEKYNISNKENIALLILGALKEYDPVSLETEAVRIEILNIVSKGLPSNWKLIIKPHPIENDKTINKIKNYAPNAIIVKPEISIENLLDEVDLVINRGNSQVVLLALKRGKPVIMIPVGISTIFDEQLSTNIIYDSIYLKKKFQDFNNFKNKKEYYDIINLHFPVSKEDSLRRVKNLFEFSLSENNLINIEKTIYISILFAFLGDIKKAINVIIVFNDMRVRNLILLYKKKISVTEFKELLNTFSEDIKIWHLKALFIRTMLTYRSVKKVKRGLKSIDAFECKVNPHYFIFDIIKKAELDYICSNDISIEQFIKNFSDYRNLSFYKKDFIRLNFIYKKNKLFWPLLRIIWVISHLNMGIIKNSIKELIK